MIGVVATLQVQDGKGGQFEAAFADLAAKVKANEPGCLLYQLTRSRADANTYKVMEMYASDEAAKHHMGTEYFRAAGPALGACLAAPPAVEYLDAVD